MFRKLTIIGFLVLALISHAQAVNDPTRPPDLNSVPARSNTTARKGPRWVLKSTLISPHRRSAVINNRVVSLGDRVKGATVVDIKPSRVRLRSGGEEITLVMLKKKIKVLSRKQVKRQERQLGK